MVRALTAVLLCFVVALPSPVEASKRKPLYTPQVKVARAWLKDRMSRPQFLCLHRLWHNESRWKVRAKNKDSGAYGIPQAWPGRKMRLAGKDWRTNALTQVKWGYRYVRIRYGTPCNALQYQYVSGYY